MIFGKRQFTPEEERLKDTFMFFSRLLLFALPLYIVIFFVDLSFFQVIVAQQSFFIFQGIGLSPAIQGMEMQVESFHFFISKDSTGWKSLLFFAALICAVPGIKKNKRVIGIVAGLPILHLGNIGRVVGIVLVEQAYGLDAAMLAHDYLWRFGLIALVLGCWLIWLWWARRAA